MYGLYTNVTICPYRLLKKMSNVVILKKKKKYTDAQGRVTQWAFGAKMTSYRRRCDVNQR